MTSIDIYNHIKPFRPTHLYIKQHTVTGKFYFGKTIKNPEKYYGSGVYWLKHIKKHGKEHVVTLWSELFIDINEIKEFALSFSNDMNIVKSEQWANLRPENGMDGGNDMPGEDSVNFGRKHSVETRLEMSLSRRGENHPFFGKKHSEETLMKMSKPRSELGKANMSLAQTGLTRSISMRNKVSDFMTGSAQSIKICPHCGKSGGNSMLRWHFDNCKSR